MKRRQFITLLGSAMAWPLGARAQQGDARRVAVLIGLEESDPQVPPRIAVIRDGLQSHGWVVGRNIRAPRALEFSHGQDPERTLLDASRSKTDNYYMLASRAITDGG